MQAATRSTLPLDHPLVRFVLWAERATGITEIEKRPAKQQLGFYLKQWMFGSLLIAGFRRLKLAMDPPGYRR